MSLEDTVRSLNQNVKEAYTALEESGYYLPEQKNAENLASTIRREFRPPIDPENATLEMIKLALQHNNPASHLPIGTEVADTYDGQSSPLIVAQYLDNTNNSSYGGAVGAICVRKYVEPQLQWSPSKNQPNYINSTIQNYLNTTYFNSCSESAKNLITSTTVPYYDGGVYQSLEGQKWFLMSITEVYGYNLLGATEGIVWKYWDNKTGVGYPSNLADAGRVLTDRSGQPLGVWLRSRGERENAAWIWTDGSISNSSTDFTRGILPACFISKD